MAGRWAPVRVVRRRGDRGSFSVPQTSTRPPTILAKCSVSTSGRAGGCSSTCPSTSCSRNTVLQPDLVFFRQERRHLIQDWEATRAAPDLGVEVLSRSIEARDRGRKMEMLARFGVPEYWIVDPVNNTIETYVLQDQRIRMRAPSTRQELSRHRRSLPLACSHRRKGRGEKAEGRSRDVRLEVRDRGSRLEIRG